MVVNADISRLDLLKFQIAVLFRIPANLYFFLFFLAIVAISARDLAAENLLAYLFLTIALAIAGFLVLASIGILLSILFATERQGFLGPHRFEIREDGFYEETGGTRTETKWSAISRIIRLKRCIYVMISAYRAHIIPRRAFESDAEWVEFDERLRTYANAA